MRALPWTLALVSLTAAGCHSARSGSLASSGSVYRLPPLTSQLAASSEIEMAQDRDAGDGRTFVFVAEDGAAATSPEASHTVAVPNRESGDDDGAARSFSAAAPPWRVSTSPPTPRAETAAGRIGQVGQPKKTQEAPEPLRALSFDVDKAETWPGLPQPPIPLTEHRRRTP